jgi:FKBP-type peptidyl-prolyl cis-trans isomerase SlyD
MRVQIVSFNCVLKNNLGQFISSSFNQDVVTTTTTQVEPSGALLPGLVKALTVLKKGDCREISLSADEAYGFYDPELVFALARSRIPSKKIKVGDLIHVETEDGDLMPCRVVSHTPKSVTLDGNHPLAGQDLVFNVEMVSTHMENDPSYDSQFEKKAGMLC